MYHFGVYEDAQAYGRSICCMNVHLGNLLRMTWEVGTKAGTQQIVSGEDPSPDCTSSCHANKYRSPRRVIVPSRQARKGRMETGQMKVVKQVATESKCSPNAGAIGSLQEIVES